MIEAIAILISALSAIDVAILLINVKLYTEILKIRELTRK